VTKASVTIVFANHDKANSPVGFEACDEITVTRQVVVGGRNKYLINGVTAQTNRVQNLFHSVQLNVNNPHFLIMQGRITKVLNMKPPETLGMIEEAAGAYFTLQLESMGNIEREYVTCFCAFCGCVSLIPRIIFRSFALCVASHPCPISSHALHFLSLSLRHAHVRDEKGGRPKDNREKAEQGGGDQQAARGRDHADARKAAQGAHRLSAVGAQQHGDRGTCGQMRGNHSILNSEYFQSCVHTHRESEEKITIFWRRNNVQECFKRPFLHCPLFSASDIRPPQRLARFCVAHEFFQLEQAVAAAAEGAGAAQQVRVCATYLVRGSVQIRLQCVR
jgi:hypothetical protein